MSHSTNKISTNFIINQVESDLKEKLHNKIVTRFPPEPNGYLHIGHAKSIFLNFGIAKNYNGLCNLRLDDTNPLKEDIEYIEAIKEDIEWLGFTWNKKERYSSDYFEQFYDYAQQLIRKGLAYVCFLSADEAKEYRGTLKKPGKNSPYRESSIKSNIKLFEQMRNGDFKENHCVLRAKIDMSSPFICMRDPTLYRIRFESHHQTGKKWCIYPMYDFAHCISDAIEGITHSLCTLEFQDNRRLYDWILENLNDFNKPNRPKQYEFSRLNLEYTVMSKRKLNTLVANSHVTGWDDPRMPTISGLRRRGYSPKAIELFCARIGVSKVDSMTDIKILEDSIRDDLNENSPRTMGVIDPIRVIIENYPKDSIETLSAPVHPQNENMGDREIFFSREIFIERDDFCEIPPNNKYKRLSIGKEVRLRNAYVIKAITFDTDFDGNITTVYAEYDKDTLGKNPSDGRKIKGVIHFVAIQTEFRIYDRLFLTENPGKHDNFEELINPNSLVSNIGFCERNMIGAELYQSYQFERNGYFCRDKDNNDGMLVMNKTVSLRDTWNN
jgi:glutaminyl-tRNA synthetase